MMTFGLRLSQSESISQSRAGGRALIPKNAFEWPGKKKIRNYKAEAEIGKAREKQKTRN
jgi:hypothetical protein